MKKPFSKLDYELLLSQLEDLKINTLEDSIGEMGSVNIRHDVDADIFAAVEMAEYERIKAIQSTYFLLDSAFYFYEPASADLFKILSNFHRIGYHNNAVVIHLTSRINISDIITRALNYLRKFSSSEIIGTASHGDPLCYEAGFLNYYLWKECQKHDPKFPNSEFLKKFNLSDFGLQYEAYFTGQTHYISDSGGRWRKDNKAVISDFKQKLAAGDQVKLQILIHPQWWDLK